MLTRKPIAFANLHKKTDKIYTKIDLFLKFWPKTIKFWTKTNKSRQKIYFFFKFWPRKANLWSILVLNFEFWTLNWLIWNFDTKKQFLINFDFRKPKFWQKIDFFWNFELENQIMTNFTLNLDTNLPFLKIFWLRKSKFLINFHVGKRFIDELEFQIDQKGERLRDPGAAPREMINLMHRCWCLNPGDRPRFSEIAAEMENYAPSIVRCRSGAERQQPQGNESPGVQQLTLNDADLIAVIDGRYRIQFMNSIMQNWWFNHFLSYKT